MQAGLEKQSRHVLNRAWNSIYFRMCEGGKLMMFRQAELVVMHGVYQSSDYVDVGSFLAELTKEL